MLVPNTDLMHFWASRAVVPNLFEFGEHLQIENKHYDGQQ